MPTIAPVDILLAGGPANSWLPQFAHTGWPGGTVALHWGHTVPIGEAEGCWFMIWCLLLLRSKHGEVQSWSDGTALVEATLGSTELIVELVT